MNNKFYVSYEAARLLKEKGYNEETDYVIDDEVKELMRSWRTNEAIPEEFADYFFSCPPKAEAIDWLDSNGIVVIVDEYYIIHEEYDYYTSCWGYYIRKNDECVCRDNSSDYKTRLEAEDAAIIKALELL